MSKWIIPSSFQSLQFYLSKKQTIQEQHKFPDFLDMYWSADSFPGFETM